MTNEPHFSYSQLSLFLRCPKQWEYKYVQHIVTPTNLNLLRGSAYHDAVALGYRHMIQYREPPDIKELLQMYSDTWDNGLKNKSYTDEDGIKVYVPGIVIGDKDPGKFKDAGIELLKLYVTTIMPDILPDEVEVRKTITYNNIQLIMYADVITFDGGVVIDHKTASRAKGEREVANDLQPSFYGLVLNKPIEFHFHEAIDVTKPYIKIAETKRNQDDYDWTGKIIMEVWKQIHAGIFPPNPTGWVCSPDHCFYYGYCRMPRSF